MMTTATIPCSDGPMSKSPSISEFLAAAPDGPGLAPAAAALQDVSEAELLSLVEQLKKLGRRDHLEALGLTKLPRTVRKAAKKAAYSLKSAGVASQASGRTGRVELPSEPIALDNAAMSLPPGMHGRMWFLLGSIPGAHAVEISTREQAELEKIDVLAPTSAAKLRKLAAKVGDADSPGMPFLANLNLAARLIDGLSEEIRHAGGRYPQEWTDVLQWREAAAQAGADTQAASARRGLGFNTGKVAADSDTLAATDRFMDAPTGGPNLPPGEVIQELAVEAIDLLAEDANEPTPRLHALADRHADRWFSKAGVRERVARLFELTADCAWARQDKDTATALLQIADALVGGERPSRIGLVRTAFRRLVDDEQALRDLAKTRGEGVL